MNRRHMLTSLKLSVVAVGIAALGVSQTYALDTKVYPGSMCRPWNNTYQFGLSSSEMYNPHGSATLDVDCPVLHDSIGYNITSASMLVRDQHSNNDIFCTLGSFYASGGGQAGWWSPVTKSSGSNGSAQTLSFLGLPTSNDAFDYFSCHIPPLYAGKASSIVSYKVTEGGPNE